MLGSFAVNPTSFVPFGKNFFFPSGISSKSQVTCTLSLFRSKHSKTWLLDVGWEWDSQLATSGTCPTWSPYFLHHVLSLWTFDLSSLRCNYQKWIWRKDCNIYVELKLIFNSFRFATYTVLSTELRKHLLVSSARIRWPSEVPAHVIIIATSTSRFSRPYNVHRLQRGQSNEASIDSCAEALLMRNYEGPV